ncbi:hypothetical protein CO151_07790 [bacterium CG_4_9_14_3_um_filter_65_15]|nr:MAG: hypothetical protein CO151_07790 [bacterium CG_4_9_14_3_um_filter_65_15]
MKKRRNYSADFKARVALEALSGAYTLAELSSKHKVHPNMIAQGIGIIEAWRPHPTYQPPLSLPA